MSTPTKAIPPLVGVDTYQSSISFGRCWHLGLTLDVNTYQSEYHLGRCWHLGLTLDVNTYLKENAEWQPVWLWLQPNTCSVSSAGVSDAFEGDRSTLETDFFRRNCVICAVLPILLAAGKQPPGKAKLQAIGQACDIGLRYKRKVKLKTQITARFKTYIWCAFSSSLWTLDILNFWC